MNLNSEEDNYSLERGSDCRIDGEERLWLMDAVVASGRME